MKETSNLVIALKLQISAQTSHFTSHASPLQYFVSEDDTFHLCFNQKSVAVKYSRRGKNSIGLFKALNNHNLFSDEQAST